MFFPFKVCSLSNKEVDIFNKYYAKDNKFIFEGVWFRSQNYINKDVSLWKDSSSNRRRTVHFKHTFEIMNSNLVMTASYLYLSTRLPLVEYEKYVNEIKDTLIRNNYVFKDNIYIKDSLCIKINEYDFHPEEEYIVGYKCVDIIIYSKGYPYLEQNYKQLWQLQVKGIREKDRRGCPIYIKSLEDIKPFLPAQVELGCGPSIDSGIDPLYYLHEIYKVQCHSDGHFYFGDEDDLVRQVINLDVKKYDMFAQIIKQCIKAKPTNFHKMLKKMYDKGLLVGTLFNNNFDHLSSILGINEVHIRNYKIDNYFPKVSFDSKVKSLICIGSHADRRFIQKQAREKGLKIIYIDPEGFNTQNGFERYLIEGAKDDDYILQLSSLEFANSVEKMRI